MVVFESRPTAQPSALKAWTYLSSACETTRQRATVATLRNTTRTLWTMREGMSCFFALLFTPCAMRPKKGPEIGSRLESIALWLKACHTTLLAETGTHTFSSQGWCMRGKQNTTHSKAVSVELCLCFFFCKVVLCFCLEVGLLWESLEVLLNGQIKRYL